MLRLLCLFVLCFSGQAFALSFEPAAPLVEVNGQIAISVQGTQGEVIWSVNKGRVEGNGNRATFFAPSEDGIATVVAIDGSGNVEKVRVTVAKKEEFTGGISIENRVWEIFTNRDVINDFAIKDNGDTLLVATTGGIELRNANTGKLIRIITNLDGLPENNIRALQVDKNNGVWVATWAGLAYWKPNGVWLVFNTNNSRLVNNFITTLSLDLNP